MKFIEFLEWDSQFFGFNIGRINIDPYQISASTLDDAVAEASTNHMKCLYFEVSFKKPELLQYCFEKKFSLVDCKTTLCKNLDITERKGKSNINHLTFELKNEYYPNLEKIAEQISDQSRFAIDQNFGKQKSLQLYNEWLRKSFYESYTDDFIIYIQDKKPIGFLTIRMKNRFPYIDLLGVSDNNKGEGIASCLIEAAQEKMIQKGWKKLKVITQGHNIRALRTYEGKNFKIESMNLFYHKWFE